MTLPGFHPDPSVVRVGGVYYLVTSSFEYLPALPIYRSTDLFGWEPIGHVAPRPEQVGLEDVPTPGGVWAPTIRYRDGVFFVVVTVFLGGRGCVVFTATDPAGPWSDGTPVPAVDGIDPDLAWDDENDALIISMTLTSAGCPLTDVLEEQTADSLDGIVDQFRINWVWMPPWGPEKITDDGRDMMRALGFSI